MSFSKSRIFLLMILLTVSMTGTAWAKMISGKISSSDAAMRKLGVEGMDPVSGESSITDIWVNGDAVLSGVSSISELKKGDQVWIEASEDTEGNLRASRVTKS